MYGPLNVKKALICISMLQYVTFNYTHTCPNKHHCKQISDAQICAGMLQRWRLGSKHPLITLRYLFLLEEATRSIHPIRHGTVPFSKLSRV